MKFGIRKAICGLDVIACARYVFTCRLQLNCRQSKHSKMWLPWPFTITMWALESFCENEIRERNRSLYGFNTFSLSLSIRYLSFLWVLKAMKRPQSALDTIETKFSWLHRRKR